MRWLTRLRSRILFLSLITLLPTAVVMVYDRYQMRSTTENFAVMEAARVADALIASHANIVEDAELLLNLLAVTPQVRSMDWQACTALLGNILKSLPRYSGLGVALPNGEIICGPGMGSVNVSTRSWFRRVMESRAFALGDYQIGQVSGKPSLGVGTPVLSRDGSVAAALYVGIDLAWLNLASIRHTLSSIDTFILTDQSGTVLTHSPDPEAWVGKSAAGTDLFRAMSGPSTGQVVEALGLDGVPRLFHVFRLGSSAFSPLYAAVGVPVAKLRAEIDRELRLGLAILAAFGLTIIGAAHLAGEPLIARPIRQLVKFSERIAKGDLSGSSGVNHAAGELGELAGSLDRMAGALALHQAKLSEQHEVLNEAQAIAHIGSWVWRTSGPRIEYSEGMAELLARSESVDEPTIDTILQSIHPEDRAMFHGMLDRASAETSRAEAELRIISGSGEAHEVWCAIRRETTVGADGHVVLRGIMQDVTARKQEERERERSSQFIKVVLDNITDGIAACDANGRLVLINKALQRMHGVSLQDSPINSLTEQLAIYHPDGKTPVAPDDLPLFRSMNGEDVSNRELVLRQKTGQNRNIFISSQAMLDSQGKRIGAVSCIHDGTDQRKTEIALRQSQKMETVGRLAGGIAHDFNNLLSIVIGNLDSLIRHLQASKERELAKEALDGALRGAELTKQMLAFSRRQKLDAVVVEVGSLLQNFVSVLQGTLAASIKTEMRISDGLWPCLADPGQVESAVLSLSMNARDAMLDGGTLTIEAVNAHLDAHYVESNSEVACGDYVRISVTDTGVGIPAEQLTRIMEPFYTTKDPGKGTGLGLSMAYGFAKQSGGHLKVYSELGHGTTVNLYLPRAQGDGETKPELGAEKLHEITGGETILVVDDDQAVRKMAVRILASSNLQVIEAVDPAGALAILAKGLKVDLVFSDVIMPGGMNGFDLAQQVSERYPGIKILLATGFAESAVRSRSPLSKKVQLLAKPYRREELLARVRQILTIPA